MGGEWTSWLDDKSSKRHKTKGFKCKEKFKLVSRLVILARNIKLPLRKHTLYDLETSKQIKSNQAKMKGNSSVTERFILMLYWHIYTEDFRVRINLQCLVHENKDALRMFQQHLAIRLKRVKYNLLMWWKITTSHHFHYITHKKKKIKSNMPP